MDEHELTKKERLLDSIDLAFSGPPYDVRRARKDTSFQYGVVDFESMVVEVALRKCVMRLQKNSRLSVLCYNLITVSKYYEDKR